MRSAFAFAAVTAVFAGTLVGGLNYTGALDPAMLRGPKEDKPGAARAGWKTHSLAAAGFSIQLPPEWVGVNPTGKVVFEERKGKKVLASLTVAEADGASSLPQQSPTTKAFRRGKHVLTFKTSQRFAASYARVFEQAAETFRVLKT
ncbi:MAG: hypothetical protein ACRDNH_07555 [Gaiellaceae bacterium]